MGRNTGGPRGTLSQHTRTPPRRGRFPASARRLLMRFPLTSLALFAALLFGPSTPRVLAAQPSADSADLQPLRAQARRVAEGLEILGAPLSRADRDAIEKAETPAALAKVLDRRCL